MNVRKLGKSGAAVEDNCNIALKSKTLIVDGMRMTVAEMAKDPNADMIEILSILISMEKHCHNHLWIFWIEATGK